MFEVMMGDPDRGATLPSSSMPPSPSTAPHPADVELDYPAWLTDLRTHWVAAGTPETEPEPEPESDPLPRGAT